MLPSESTVRRFLSANGLDARSLKAGRLENGPTKAFEAPATNDLWMVDLACGPTLRGPDGKVISTRKRSRRLRALLCLRGPRRLGPPGGWTGFSA